MDQQESPGTAPTSTRITGEKLTTMLLDTGGQMYLNTLLARLRDAQKQHPNAVGLTLAIAFVERDKAEVTMKTSRVVLAAAAKAHLDFEGRVLTSGIEGDALVVRVLDEPPTTPA